MPRQTFDAIVVGAGFAGLYMLHLLRAEGLAVKGLERGHGVGGTWYWNRYPGCRCDVESIDYSYQFSDDLQQAWTWTERYAAQPEILAYAEHVANRFHLLPLIQFDTRVTEAHYNEQTHRWTVATHTGDMFDTRYLIMATGCLSATNTPEFPGLQDFTGRTIHTGLWPQEDVDFSGRRVGIIGTGSSAIQSIPIIAAQAADLTVFQRTANFSVPARNGPIDQDRVTRVKSNYGDYRRRARQQAAAFGPDNPRSADSVFTATPDERRARFEARWETGGFAFLGAFGDLMFNEDANAHAAEFVRSKIRATVQDPAVAKLLSPKGIIGCKRLCADTNYYETYNRTNVHLVDISQQPIERFTPAGLVTGGKAHAFDDVIFATGFDAMTGTLLRMDIRGTCGQTLHDKWAAGPLTYLGLMTAGFPNLFMMTGPGSPSVLANMVTGVEQHAEYIRDMIAWIRREHAHAIEATPEAEAQWVQAVNTRSQ
ncbi:MAG: flavin-containing monooxygenase, partial [Gammaproteobacteria bacterium]